MNFKSLRAFQLVVERGSLSAAAADLCLSQPAVSRLIAQLEGDLNLRLFDRTGRRLTMTKEGKLFYDATRHILAGLDEIPRIAEDIRTGNRHLQILTTPRIAQALISPALAMLRKQKIRLRCRVEVISQSDLDASIGSRRFDLAIASFPISTSTPVACRPIFKVRLEAVLPKGHPLAKRDRLTASDLASEDLIGPWQDQFWRREMGDFLAGGGDAPKCIIETRSSLMACRMACDGAGIALLDRLSARALDVSGAEFRPLEPEKWITFGYVHHRGDDLSANAADFISAVRTTLEDIRALHPEMAECIALMNETGSAEREFQD
jgi:DNA-binding transcriptional LysR family regulator